MKYKELSTKTDAELQKLLEDLRHDAHRMAVQIRTSELKQTHKLKAAKKDIARVLTFLKTKQS